MFETLRTRRGDDQAFVACALAGACAPRRASSSAEGSSLVPRNDGSWAARRRTAAPHSRDTPIGDRFPGVQPVPVSSGRRQCGTGPTGCRGRARMASPCSSARARDVIAGLAGIPSAIRARPARAGNVGSAISQSCRFLVRARWSLADGGHRKAGRWARANLGATRDPSTIRLRSRITERAACGSTGKRLVKDLPGTLPIIGPR